MTQQRVSPISVTSTLPAVPVLSLQAALGQTANLQEWRDFGGNVLSSFDQFGRLRVRSTTTSAFSAAIEAASAATVGLLVKGAASQTADLQQWQDSAGGIIAKLTATPRFVVGSTDLSSTFSVVGHATGGVTMAVRGVASQTADLQQWQNNSGTVLARVSSSGSVRLDNAAAANNVRTNFFQANSGADATLGALIAEFGNQPSATATSRYTYFLNGDNNAFRNFIFYPTSTNIDGRVGINEVAPGAKLHITTPISTSIGLIVKGAASQTANLQEWQDSAGGILARITSAGTAILDSGATVARLAVNTTLGGGIRSIVVSALTTETVFVARGIASQTGNLTEWQNSAATVLAGVSSGGFGFFGLAGASSGQVSIQPTSASTLGFLVRGAASQSADLQQWQDSSANVLLAVNSVGEIRTRTDNSQYLILQNKTTGTTGNYGLYMDSGNSRLQIWTATTARATFTGDGNIGFFGTSFGSGTNVIALANAGTVPSTNPTAGGVLYAEGGALKWRGSSGTVTTIANA